MGAWISAGFDWKSVEPPEQIDIERVPGGPHLLGLLNIELILTTRRAGWFQEEKWQSFPINEACLKDAAFRPKAYSIRLEQGSFAHPCQAGSQNDDDWPWMLTRFALRLVFDNSPYPPRSEWKKPDGGPDSLQFWNRKEFVAREIPQKQVNSSQWSQCVVS